MHFAPLEFGAEGMAQFVDKFQRWIQHEHQQQVVRGQRVDAEVVVDLRPVLRGLQAAINHQAQPQQRDPFAENPVDLAGMSIEEVFRIPQRETQRDRVGKALLEFACLLARLAFKQFLGVGQRLAFQQIRFVQLAHQVDDFFLPRRILVQLFADLIENFLHRVIAIHQADELVGGWIEAVAATGGRVFQQVPDQAAIIVAMNLYLLMQPGPQAGDPVPVGAD